MGNKNALKNGFYTKEVIEERKQLNEMIQSYRETLEKLSQDPPINYIKFYQFISMTASDYRQGQLWSIPDVTEITKLI